MTIPQWTRWRIVRYPAIVIALAVLIPATVWFSAHRDYDEYQKTRASDPIRVAKGESVHWRGATWRLLDYTVDPPPEVSSPVRPLPVPGTLVRARIRVQADSAGAAKNLLGCSIGLRDPQNRRWGVGYADPTAYPHASTSCGPPDPGFGKKAPPATDPYTLEIFYRVPEQAARDGSPMVVFIGARPKYLLFQR
ncbi:MAG TPA: hypothetical protein VHC49_12800 [Mycobacteriales bacterium]|nr:hypothetical protein [Mycobacteriales bacterium]